MINVKLFVTLVLSIIGANCSNFCEICLNHTLCKYSLPGPSKACVKYNVSALLTRPDIVDIVLRINERRNHVANGLAKRLPKAANMMRISWSEDLALSAQRWVDQCDPMVQPDRHDQCRNLKGKAVGQIIATVIDPTHTTEAKRFIDIWFKDSENYAGNIFYFNESVDARTEYFTQLIWAETNSVGCGKAKFYINKRNSVIERLVCNFAPSGNIKGKPVYIIGSPATMCPENCTVDDDHTGLCTHQTQNNGIKSTTKSKIISSLLKIVKLSISSEKDQSIDAVKDFIKHSDDEYGDHRRLKARHVANGTHVGFPRFLPRPQQWNNLNNSRNFPIPHYQPPRGQFQVYHGENFIPPYTTVATEHDFRRFDMLTQPPSPLMDSYTGENYRKFNQCGQCTRRPPMNNCNVPQPCVTDKCTRGQRLDCGVVTPPCVSNTQTPHVFPHSRCPCSSPTTCLPPACSSCCSTTCPCSCHINTPSFCCHKFARSEDQTKDETRKSAELHYYDIFPNIALRSGDSSSEMFNDGNEPVDEKVWLLYNNTQNKQKNKIIKQRRKEHNLKNNRQITHGLEHANYMNEEQDYSYRFLDSRQRKKRNPFKQMDDYEPINPLYLKSLRYTTLRNAKNKNNRKTTRISVTVTEPITFAPNSLEGHTDYIDRTEHNTEKYLSFDELMHLRKINSGDWSARRKGMHKTKTSNTTSNESERMGKKKGLRSDNKVSVETSTKPVNYSAVPTFERKKCCTRRLTCTWTAFTATASDGSIIIHQANGGGGSRTPPGYVEGCTRTSTCTREFMNRNKISTLPMSTEPDKEEEDEEYCE